MRSRTLICAGALLAASAGASAAQSVGNMVVNDVKNGVGDMVAVWVSPFHDSGKDWLLAAGAIAASASTSPADVSVDNFLLHHRGSFGFLNPVREGGFFFSGTTLAPAAAGLYIIGIATKNRPIRDAVWGCVASYGAESLVRTQVMYRVVSRVRPDSVRTNGGLFMESASGDQYKFQFGNHGWGQQSLPAGHFANVMACASFLSHRFHMGWGAPVAYAFAGAVGVGRMVDRRHWLSDTVLGGFIGYAIGNTIAPRSRARADKDGQQLMAPDGMLNDLYITPTTDGRLALGFGRKF